MAPRRRERNSEDLAGGEGAAIGAERPTKFTPERVEQIRDLVASGKSRDAIAALLGLTVGSLQVTCSKLGISLAAASSQSKI
jgi:hypothetical protein